MIEVLENVSLKEYTTFKIGGPAKFFVEIESEEQLEEALAYAKENELAVFILGGGSNILASDKGFDGLAIRMSNSKCEIQNEVISCGAGTPLSELVKIAKENSLSGLEWAAGIPGTIGGAVRGNAAAYKGSISDSIEIIKALCLDLKEFQIKHPNFQFPIDNFQSNSNEQIFEFLNNDCKFGYRDSIFKQNPNLIITSVNLKLRKGNKEEIETKMKEIILKRAGKIPQFPSAGSFYTNPIVSDAKLIEEFEKTTGAKSRDGKIPAGWIIESAGLAGKAIGGAQVSEKHANFIVNTGNATAEDVVMLSSIIKRKVRDEFGVQLIEEVQLAGF